MVTTLLLCNIHLPIGPHCVRVILSRDPVDSQRWLQLRAAMFSHKKALLICQEVVHLENAWGRMHLMDTTLHIVGEDRDVVIEGRLTRQWPKESPCRGGAGSLRRLFSHSLTAAKQYRSPEDT